MRFIRNPLEKWRNLLWPIKRYELRKFWSMATLMFLILLNQNLIRGIKDSLVVNLLGTESLSFIKLFVEMPVGILFVIIYTTLCNKMNTETIFRVIVLFFLFFFVLSGFFFFPCQTLLHPSPHIVDHYIRLYPYLKWFFIMWSKWTLVLFYMMGELWPMIIFTLLYWQLAHKITKTEEAGRFYFFFNLFGQTNLLVSGSIMIYFTHNPHFSTSLLDNQQATIGKMTMLMTVIIAICLMILLLHRYIEKEIIYTDPSQTKSTTRGQLSLWESIKMIGQSKYLLLISLLMVSYSTVINLIETLWFYETSLFYKKDPLCFMTYQGRVLFWTGITVLISSFLGNLVIQKLGWLGTALLTPLMTLVTGGLFFILVVAKQWHFLPEQVSGTSTLALIVAIGAIQNILAKGSKYCFFDVTKEIAYMPLNGEMQTKGKAAVDILGGKIGKSMGAILQVICYTLFSTKQPNQLAPFFMVLFFCICTIWLSAVWMLSKRYHKLVLTS